MHHNRSMHRNRLPTKNTVPTFGSISVPAALAAGLIAACWLTGCRNEQPAASQQSRQSDREASAVAPDDAPKGRAEARGGDRRTGESVRRAIRAGVDYLLTKQSDDGRWQSEYYGNMKPGSSTTALVLYALAHAKPHLRDWPEAAFDKAFKALQPAIREKGYVTSSEGVDYSNYASAMYLVAARQSKHPLPEELESKLVSYLMRAQLDESEGLAPADVDYGGWDLSGWMTGPRATAGTNISVTSFVFESLSAYWPLSPPGPAKPGAGSDTEPAQADNETRGAAFEALRRAGGIAERPRSGVAERPRSGVTSVLTKAVDWSRGVQNWQSGGDGGFFFHPELEHAGNKAGWQEAGGRPRSYGSTTADGVRLLGMARSIRTLSKPSQNPNFANADLSRRLERATTWLAARDEVARVPGFRGDSNQHSWALGLRYYYWFSLAKSLDFLSRSDARRLARQIQRQVLAEQRADGHWQNHVARMREDDPLIATSLAIVALSQTLRWNDEGE